MVQIIKLISLLIILVTPVKTLPLNPNGPIYQEYATSCILEIFEDQFVDKFKQRGNKTESISVFENGLLTILIGHNLSVAGFGIESKVIERINQKQKWSMEILSEQRTDFESGKYCIDNCDTPEEDQKIYKTFFQPAFKTQFCFMIVEKEEDFLYNFQNFANTKSYNVLAKFLIYIPVINDKYEYIAKAALNYLWMQKIFHAAVLIPKNSLNFFNVYSSNVYSNSKICGESPTLILKDTCKKGKIRKHTKIFGAKLPRIFNNCSIKAIAVKYPPFVINEESGFEIRILKEIGNILNIIFNISFSDAVDWGEKNASSSYYTGLLQQVIDESAVAVGNIVAKPEFGSDFSLTTQYSEEDMVWVVPIAAEIPLWKNIFIIFKFEVWIVCLVYFILTAVLFQFFANREEVRYFRSLGKNIMASLSLLIGVACCVQPKTLMVRTFFILLAVFSMILVILYQSVLMTSLTNHAREKQISSLEDILSDPEMGIGGMSSYKDIFNDESDPVAMKIYNMFETYDAPNDTAEQWLKTVSIDRDTCTLMSRFYVRYLISQDHPSVVDKHGPTVFMMKDIVFTYPIRMLLPNGFPLEEKFNKVISYLINGGIIENWASKYKNKVSVAHQNETLSEEHEEYGALTLTHFNGAFNLLIFGYIVATVAFLMELIFWKFEVVKKFQNLKVKLKNIVFKKH